MKDSTRDAAKCKTDVVTFAKRMLRASEVDATKFVRFALQECRARIMADAVECDPTLKDACKEALVDNRGTDQKDKPGANAPETINAGGEDHTRGVEELLVAKKEAAKKYAHCKMVYTTSEWTAQVKEACLEKAKGSFQNNGGNDGQWTAKHMSKVEKLGDSYAKGETTVIATKPSIDFCTEMAGACGDAAQILKINSNIKDACGDATKCEVADKEQIEKETAKKCKYCFTVKHASDCTDDATCDAFAKKMAAKSISSDRTGRRRLLNTGTNSASTTVDECPSSGCADDSSVPTMPPTVRVTSSGFVPYASAAAVGVLALVAMVIA
jgi:hypothetical protein